MMVEVLLLIDGTCGWVYVLGYRNSLMTSMIARCPLLVVTLGAERRSMPFFWLSARITTWNCGFVKTPANPNIDGATPATCPRPGTKSASSAFALIAKSPLRFPDVTGFCPIGTPLALKGKFDTPLLDTGTPFPTFPPEPKTFPFKLN